MRHILNPLITLALLPLGLAGCGGDYSPNTYAPAAVQQAAKVDQGVIVGIRAVDITSNGALGAATGAAAGGIVGSQAPGGGMTAAIGAVGGSLVGGLIGTTAEHVSSDTTAYEYVVRKKSGELVSVTQKDKVAMHLGQAVLVIAGPQARVVVDYTMPDSPPETKPIAIPAPKPQPPEAARADADKPDAAKPAAGNADTAPAEAAIVAKLPAPPALTPEPVGPPVAAVIAPAITGTAPATPAPSTIPTP